VISSLLAAAEPSKVPFYIAGGLLALWAVMLSWLGLTRPDFPFGQRGQRGVISISFVLFVIAVGAAIGTS
jgi:hypothetical protein